MTWAAVRFLGGLCIAGGVFFSFAAVVAILRFPDVYTRLHGSAKALSGGEFSFSWSPSLHRSISGALKLLHIALFFAVSNPMASHAIARACRRRDMMKEPGGEHSAAGAPVRLYPAHGGGGRFPEDLLSSFISLSVMGVLMATVFALLRAPDVALTQAIINSAS
jgi:multicomponent Na+:H+ antiporter subunit G